MDVSFIQLTRRDLDDAMLIEAGCAPHAWDRKTFWRKLKDPMVRATALQVDGTTRGFTVCAPEGLTCHLLNIAVATEWRRKGLATRAIKDVEQFAREKTLVEVAFEVRESNLPAQMLYKKLGYEAIDILHAHYGDDDAYKMRKPIYLEG